MVHYDFVAQFFHQQIEQASLSVDAIADIAGNAAALASEALLSERKLFSCAVGADCAAATLLSELLRKGLVRERPALPVIELCARHSEPNDAGVTWLTQQLNALGQPGDVAVIFAGGLHPVDVERLANALGKRQVRTLWVGAQGPGPSLVFPGAPQSTVLSLSCASAACLAELIDITTFGPWEDDA